MSEYVWDYRNRLTNVRQRNSSGGAVVQEQIYRYDPMDRRIGVGSDPDGAGSQPATWQWTVYDGQNPYADFDNSGSLTNRFLSGDAVDQFFGRFSASGTAAWYLADQLGSVRDIANTSGSVIDHIKYDSFGKLITESSPTNGDRFKYTGREYDATTKQYNYRARYYDAAIGRFTSEDPIGLKGGDTNVYRYTGNSPTFMIDPTGLADTPVSGGGYGPTPMPPPPHRRSTIDCHRPYVPPRIPHPPLPTLPASIPGTGLDHDTHAAVPPIPTPPGPPPVPPPGGSPDGGWKWNPNPGNGRGGTWGPKVPLPGQSQPSGSWDPEGHWDIDDGRGRRHRYTPDGKPITPEEAHKPQPKPIVPPEAIKTVVVVGAGIGTGYIIYRAVRMIPSLFPPAWPTIPVNLAVP